ncbi:MAG: aminopeptidase P family protein, partial [Phycisphaerae bacterium]
MTDLPFRPTAPPTIYRARRAQLAAGLARPLVLPAGHARARSYATNTYPFRAASDYLYFGGPPVEGAVWLIEPGSDGDEGCTLLRPAYDADASVWTGRTAPDSALAECAGVRGDGVVGRDKLEALLAGRPAGVVRPPCPITRDWIAAVGLEAATEDELAAIIELRLIKHQYELVAMRRAAEVTVAAHRAALAAAVPDQGEADVAAAFVRALVAEGCVPSFTPIVTVCGDVLHTSGYGGALTSGALVLVDAGAEEPGGYACDVTRTYPVGGRFSTMQRQLYDTVLRAQREAIAACVPGRRFRDIHDAAARTICAGLIEADLLRGDADELAARRAHTLFFYHGLGHLIGLDVHDMEDFGDLAGYAPDRERRPGFGDRFLRLDRDLEPGMTVTIEPGVYVSPAVWSRDDLVGPLADCVNRPAVDVLLAERFGGIRIEDTVHVLASNAPKPEVLTSALPSDADAVAAAVGGVSSRLKVQG